MKKLSEKQIKTLMRLVVRAENGSITESGAAVYGELHGVLVDMLAVLPTKRAPDAGDSAASQALSPQSGVSTPEVDPAASQRR